MKSISEQGMHSDTRLGITKNGMKTPSHCVDTGKLWRNTKHIDPVNSYKTWEYINGYPWSEIMRASLENRP